MGTLHDPNAERGMTTPPAATDPLLAWLKPIEERAAKATTGPWWQGDTEDNEFGNEDEVYAGTDAEPVIICGRPLTLLGDARFIAAARTDVPAMAAKIRELAEAMAWYEEAASAASRYVPEKNTTAMTSLLVQLSLDGGSRARAALAPPAPAKGSVTT